MNQKRQKYRLFWARYKLQNHSNEGKGKQKKKERGEGREKKRKKTKVALLVFIMRTLEKKLLDAKGPFGSNVFKNQATNSL